MPDFEQKLLMLAERGTPVGPEELIERVERELAGLPLVGEPRRRERQTMTTTEERTVTQSPPPRRGVAWAAIAFVLVIGMGAVLFAATTDDNGPADDPTTTTTSEAATTTTEATPPPTTEATPPPTTEPPTTTKPPVPAADQAVIDAFVATFNSGDWEATLASLAPDATVSNGIIGGPLRLDEARDPITRLFRMFALQESRMTVSSCEPVEDGSIDCRGTFTDVIVDRSPLGEAGLFVTFDVDTDGQVSQLDLEPNAALMLAAYGHFFNWLDEHHPGDSGILAERTGSMSLRDDALELLPIRTAEWIASLEQ